MKLLSVDDSMFIFSLIWHILSFILGQGWLLSNRFCKACQNCLRPSGAADAWIVALLWKLPQNATMQRKQCQLGQKQFWHVSQNWSLCSHPWPNMNEQCTKWKYNDYAIMHWNQFCYIFFHFEKFGVKFGFVFLLTLYSGQYVMCLLRNACTRIFSEERASLLFQKIREINDSKAVFIIFPKLETRFNTHYQNA